MIVDSCNGRYLQFSWGLLVLINCSVTFYWIFFSLPLIRVLYLFIAAQNSKTLIIANTTYYLFAAFLISGDLELAAVAHTGSSCPPWPVYQTFTLHSWQDRTASSLLVFCCVTVDRERGIICPSRFMGSFSGILVVGPPHDPLGKTHFLARKNPNVWGDCPANQLASPSPQASLFGAAYSFRGYASEMHWPRKPGNPPYGD